jgi:hypothetical protein
VPDVGCSLVVSTSTAQRLASWGGRYQAIAPQVSEVGYIASGSVASRSTRCGKANCACRADPPRLHGPYWLFTAKVDGKTVNKTLSDREAQLYQQWIANDRALRALLAEMREVADEARAIILAEEASNDAGRRPSVASPGNRRAASRRSR